MSIIKLQSSDGEIFDVEKQVAKCSNTIRTMLDDLGIDVGEGEVIPVPNVKGFVLRKILEWATYHKDDRAPQEDEIQRKCTYNISQWDREFLKIDQGFLFELMVAANYLDIQGLQDVTCKTVANMIMGKTPEEIREMFNIENDLTPEEERQIRLENQWVEEI